MKGTVNRSLLLFPMKDELQRSKVTEIALSSLESDPEIFLVEIRITPGNNIKVFADADNGMSIEKCASLNRLIYKQLEESGMFPEGNFSLEVSSPGLDEPLKIFRQYQKNVGRNVEAVLADGTKREGRLIAVEEKEIVIEEARGKKKEVVRHNLLLDNIKTTKIQVVF